MLAFDHQPFRLLCPYNVETLSDSVIQSARLRHAYVVRADDPSQTTSFVGEPSIGDPGRRAATHPAKCSLASL